MIRLLLISLLLSGSGTTCAQQDLLVFKKRDQPIAYFRKDAYIVFQLKNRQWYSGYINKIQNDTFDINPMVIHYSMKGADTVHYVLLRVALKDIYAMPRKGELVNYVNEHAVIILGHEHWVWLKNGLILRAGAGGYILLNLLNGLIKKINVFSGAKLGIAAGIFLAGEILHQTYRPELRIGKKYHLESIRISN